MEEMVVKVIDDSMFGINESKSLSVKMDKMCGIIVDQSGQIALIQKDGLYRLLTVDSKNNMVEFLENEYDIMYVQNILEVVEKRYVEEMEITYQVFVGRVNNKDRFKLKESLVKFVSPEEALKLLNDNNKVVEEIKVDKYDILYDIKRNQDVLRYYFINYIY